MDRVRLRQDVYRSGLGYSTLGGRSIVICPWCGEQIANHMEGDLHEALVKRSAVPKDRQELIFVKHNCVLLHHGCHMAHGVEQEMTRRCLRYLAMTVGARYIGRWYYALWNEHGLAVNKGLLIPPKAIKVYEGVRLMEAGVIANRLSLPEMEDSDWVINPGTRHSRDFRALCVMRWRTTDLVTGKKGSLKKAYRPPVMHAGVSSDDLIEAVEAGYWLDYIARTMGFTVEEVMT